MSKALVLLLFIAPVLASSDTADILYAIKTQQTAWNRGDIPAFMDTYSGDCTFVGSEILRGRDAVLARYRKRYPTKAAMGTLRFSGLEIKLLGTDYASVIGRFRLERPKGDGGNASGVFTLLFRKTAQGWKILLDHTS